MHFLVKLSGLVLLAVLVGQLDIKTLAWLTLVMVIACLLVNRQHWLQTIKRVRWLLVVMAVVYLVGTPGQYLDWPVSWMRPTYEGVYLGVTQILRIIAMLSGLSMLLSTTSSLSLISGLYQLTRCFEVLGFDASRFASRLWLTLHYVEQQNQTTFTMKHFHQQLNVTTSDTHQTSHETITLSLIPLRWSDKLWLLLMLVGVLAWIGF